MKRFKRMPELPTGYPLNKYIVEVVLARAAQNIAINGSFELNADNWTAVGGSIARSAAWQRYGTYSLLVTPSAGVNDGVYYGGATPLALNAGGLYFASAWGKFAPGLPYRMYFATTGGAQVGNRVRFIGRGRPQRVVVPYYETANASRRVYIAKDSNANVRPFYLDGFQAEADRLTDYLDGSLRSFVPNEYAYTWDAAPHASTSRRSASTRSGGEVVPFTKYYFTLMAIMGLGIHPPNNVASALSMIGGSIYQRTIPASERVFDLVGDFRLQDADELDEMIEKLSEAITYANSATQAPILLRIRLDEEKPGKYSEVAEIPCLYTSGLEGERTNRIGASADIRFTTYLPVIRRQGEEGALLHYQDKIIPNNFIRRSPDGSWGSAGGGVTGGFVVGGVVLPNGKIVVYGDFSSAGGVANTRAVALYDPVSDTFSAMGTGGDAGASIYAAAASPSGREVTMVGTMAGMGGTTDTNKIAVYSFDTNTWQSLAIGFTGTVIKAIAYRPNGNFVVGGIFTVIDGVAVTNIAEYDGATWTSLGNPGGPVGQQALYAPNGTDIIAGLESTASALVHHDGVTWTTLSTVPQDAMEFAVATDGSLYFLDESGGSSKLYRWNGYAVTALYDITGKVGVDLYYDARSGALYVSSNYTEIDGVASLSGVYIYTGGPAGTFIGLDFATPGTPAPTATFVGLDGSLYFGVGEEEEAWVSHTNVITNSGSADANPVARFKGPGFLWQLKNISTGELLYFNIELLDGEQAFLYLLHDSVRFISDFRGDITWGIVPGSAVGSWHLAPGDNLVNVFMTYRNSELNDDDDTILWIDLQGLDGVNTDDGRLYVRVQLGGGQYSIDFFTDAALTNQVASTGLEAGSGVKDVVAFNQSGVTGTLIVQGAPPGDDNDIIMGVPISDMNWVVNYSALTGIVK